MPQHNQPLVAVAWSELPAYSARLLRAGIKAIGSRVEVLASRPVVPVPGVEAMLGQRVHWLDYKDRQVAWPRLGLPTPRIFFHTGWCVPSFNALGRSVRDNGGSVVSLIDNSFKANLRQCVGAIIYRCLYRRWFEAVWVPGVSGMRLCRFLGVPRDRIYPGLYAADPLVFRPGPPLAERRTRFLFVGQFIKRKGVEQLLAACRLARRRHLQLPLIHVVGCGPLEPALLAEPWCKVTPFATPDAIAARMADSRFLILPSLGDHWPLVVHEAVSCGCGLIISDQVGNRFEFLSEKNGYLVKAGDAASLLVAILNAAALPQSSQASVMAESLQLSRSFSPPFFSKTFVRIVHRHLAGTSAGDNTVEHPVEETP